MPREEPDRNDILAVARYSVVQSARSNVVGALKQMAVAVVAYRAAIAQADHVPEDDEEQKEYARNLHLLAQQCTYELVVEADHELSPRGKTPMFGQIRDIGGDSGQPMLVIAMSGGYRQFDPHELLNAKVTVLVQ